MEKLNYNGLITYLGDPSNAPAVNPYIGKTDYVDYTLLPDRPDTTPLDKTFLGPTILIVAAIAFIALILPKK